jgi:hypothetical protein
VREEVGEMTSSWRNKFKVHPAADCFPMMSDEELRKLGEDIKANGLKNSIGFSTEDDLLLDGRNRLEAMERVGVPNPLDGPSRDCFRQFYSGDPVAHIIGLNIHRRHLTKQQIADILVADALKGNLLTNDEVSKGGRGKVNKVKATVVAQAKERGISKATVERALAKATPKPKPKPVSERGHTIMKRPLKSKSGPVYSARGIDAARQNYLRCAELVADLDAEREVILEAFRQIAGKAPGIHRRGARRQ